MLLMVNLRGQSEKGTVNVLEGCVIFECHSTVGRLWVHRCLFFEIQSGEAPCRSKKAGEHWVEEVQADFVGFPPAL